MLQRLVTAVGSACLVTACSAPFVATNGESQPAGPASSIEVPDSEPSDTTGSSVSSIEPSGDESSTSLPEPAAETDVQELAEYVEKATGRTFDPEPIVDYVDDGPETIELGPDFFTDERMWQLLTLLGLIEPSDDINGDMTRAAQARLDQVRGLCCPVQMFETEDHPLLTSVVVVHELTHLVDLQRLAEMPLAADDESVNLNAVVSEGNAQRVALAYRRQLQGEGARAERFAVDWSHPDIPDAFLQILEFPYQEGARFSSGLESVGGLALVDQSFARPPVSSKQVLDVEAYVNDDRPIPVVAPGVDHQARHDGAIGAFVLKLLLEQQIPNGDALLLARNWLGDAYVIYQSGSQLCLAATVALESDAAARQLLEVVQGSELTASGGRQPTHVDLQRCLG